MGVELPKKLLVYNPLQEWNPNEAKGIFQHLYHEDLPIHINGCEPFKSNPVAINHYFRGFSGKVDY